MTRPDADGGPDAPGEAPRLSPEEAAAVIRRAAELDGTPGDDAGLDRDALVEAAAEVGFSTDAVEQALAEHDAAALGVRAAAGRAGVLGPAVVDVGRVVPLHPEVAAAAVDRWLRKQTYDLRRRVGVSTRWVRRDDFGATARRKADWRKRIRLDDPDEVVATVVPAGDGRSFVRFRASLVDMRAGLRSGMIGFPLVAGPAVGAIAGFATGAVVFPIVGVPAGIVLAAAGSVGGRRTLAASRSTTEEILEGFLDDLAQT